MRSAGRAGNTAQVTRVSIPTHCSDVPLTTFQLALPSPKSHPRPVLCIPSLSPLFSHPDDAVHTTSLLIPCCTTIDREESLKPQKFIEDNHRGSKDPSSNPKVETSPDLCFMDSTALVFVTCVMTARFAGAAM